MKKVLVLCHHRLNRSPGQRYRYEQYIPFLEKNGFVFTISNLLNEKDDKAFYSKGKYFRKFLIYLKSWKIRIADWVKANQYDIIFIYRDALITGSTFFEKKFAKTRAKIIYDFDDAIWLHGVSDANSKFSFLKNPDKTKKIIQLSDIVIVGNQFLASYALQFNKNVVIIPSTINTGEYKSKPFNTDKEEVCIGWTGSPTTIKHFVTAIPVLKKIKTKYGSKISFKIIGDQSYYCSDLNTQGIPWSAATEVDDLLSLDIGIMPLPDNEWERGKCGMKGLQYMGLGIPTVMSPIGANKEIIQNGANGYLPDTQEDWIDILSNLIENKALRQKIGYAGRKTVVEKYSTEVWEKVYLNYFKNIVSK
jgi:glycosyltransferase involved in cell wall biosynthesis